ncbi:protein of unknown function DUF610 YibQ [Alkalidesulfovibrio alkalitolerans DSM 16529]|uniref:Divergent polysaccharide deacetylase family protein n=1 Tax=Alkalidesulfovibrio alkalitolerans DSM 16529 TaxID=1121439 RepID=S7UQL7_9BACT|nr:divergent polysaccharide deacetylase family protein [Alkalidesulfovibrio alkalitolerans]EPR34603.1 protein of unknown function DUF610 YibQ [Alkalidesulfovibrio alkalitolerans DSM 16529]
MQRWRQALSEADFGRRLRAFARRRWPWLAVAVFILVFGMAAAWLASFGNKPSPVAAPAPESSVVGHVGLVFEDYSGVAFEDELKRVDYSLLLTLRDTGVDPERFSLQEVTHIHEDDLDYLRQTILVRTRSSVDEFTALLKTHLTEHAPNSVVAAGDDGILRLSLMGRPTHELRLAPPETPPPTLPLRLSGQGVLAIVIDDLGENRSFAKALTRLPFPVTFAIWPHASHTAAVARTATAAGLDVIIHQPMEPKGYPRINPGPGALLTNMSEDEIRVAIRDSIARLPQAVGMNNHMGSAFTADAKAMRAVMAELAQKGLFFLDSRTSNISAANATAAEFNVVFLGRHIFLDNVPDEEAVLMQLHKAERIALKNGAAVAIGHPHPGTLAALERFATKHAPGLTMVPVSQLAGRVLRQDRATASSKPSTGAGTP